MAETHLTKKGEKFVIRAPIKSDAADLIDYSRVLFASTDQVLTTLQEYTMTTAEEEIWIARMNSNPNTLALVAEMRAKIVGLLFFVPNTKRKMAHSGEFGVSVHPEYQGLGIGRKLIEQLLQWASFNKTIEKVMLSVLATNVRAIELYRAMGFIEEGRQVKAIKQLTGEYVDTLLMYRETR